MEYFFVTVRVAKVGDPLVAVDLRIKARSFISAASKLNLFMTQYDFSTLFCFRSMSRLQFNKLSHIPCL